MGVGVGFLGRMLFLSVIAGTVIAAEPAKELN